MIFPIDIQSTICCHDPYFPLSIRFKPIASNRFFCSPRNATWKCTYVCQKSTVANSGVHTTPPFPPFLKSYKILSFPPVGLSKCLLLSLNLTGHKCKACWFWFKFRSSLQWLHKLGLRRASLRAGRPWFNSNRTSTQSDLGSHRSSFPKSQKYGSGNSRT